VNEELLTLWYPAFATTILVEAPIYALFMAGRAGLVWALLTGVALQALTHPIFWLSWGALGQWPYENYVLAVGLFESTIVLVEAAAVWLVLPPRRPWQRVPNLALALLASVVANTTSVVVGLLNQ
jgi:hypothetical protein